MPQETATQTLTEILNKQIANFSVLYVKLHNYHWFVKGEGFFDLHIKFEEFYNETATCIDELAERLLAIKGRPLATMRDFLQNSSITEAKGNENSQQMVQSISQDFTTIVEELKRGIAEAEQVGDHPTADMLIGIRTNLEKHIWMLESYLGK